MEFTHGKSWSYAALVLGFTTLLLYYYGEPYSWIGVFIGFMSLVYMSAMYFNLHTQYEQVMTSEEMAEIIKRREDFSS